MYVCDTCYKAGADTDEGQQVRARVVELGVSHIKKSLGRYPLEVRQAIYRYHSTDEERPGIEHLIKPKEKKSKTSNTAEAWMREYAARNPCPVNRLRAKMGDEEFRRVFLTDDHPHWAGPKWDRVVVLNLDRRTDRLETFQSMMMRESLPMGHVTRVSGVDGNKVVAPPSWWRASIGGWGCYQSHLKILNESVERGDKSLFVFEDDAVLCPGFFEKYLAFCGELPDDWDMIYLGGYFVQKGPMPVPISPRVVRGFNVIQTHAYGMRGDFIKRARDYIQARLESPDCWHVDYMYGMLHMQGPHHVYCAVPWLVTQAAGKSDIS